MGFNSGFKGLNMSYHFMFNSPIPIMAQVKIIVQHPAR